MLKVGLTGGLASGKTFVANLFAGWGCHVAYADRMGHEALLSGGEAYDEVVRQFGTDILGGDGEINRRKLGNIVFAHPEKLDLLSALVHPHVFRRQDEFFERIARDDPAGVAIVEAAIMIESGSYLRYDRIVLAICPPEMQIERFARREDSSEEEARQRLARQMPLEEKRAFADYVVDTSGSKEETTLQARQVYERLKEEATCNVE